MEAKEAFKNAGYNLVYDEGGYMKYVNVTKGEQIVFFVNEVAYMKSYTNPENETGIPIMPPTVTEKENFAIQLQMQELGAM